jgi:hypothetical protein
MSASDLVHLLARAHPAVVHAPLGAALFLPAALGLALRARRHRRPAAREWLRTAWFLAILGVLGGLAAIVSGYAFARELGGIAPGAWLARPVRPEPSFPALLRHHQILALLGLPAGVACLALLARSRRGGAWALGAALLAALVWLGLWGAAGHWGGRMVFRDPAADGERP